MSNPVLVETLRGDTVENRHRGSVFVCDADGAVVLDIGDKEHPVFPRSAVKVIQALPLIETGAADAYGFDQREMALACSSHNGEPVHTELALAMLKKAGLDETTLECGAHWPSLQAATVDLARNGGTPSGLHNNCSGKHSGFLCVCCHAGVDHHGYVSKQHWLQETVRVALEEVTGAAHNEATCGIDGCSIPSYAVPLKNLALGFARMATGRSLGVERAKAVKRLFAACMAESFLIAGTDRSDTALMQAAPGRIFTKVGADGVFCAAVPELGLGIALKVDDGTGRAADVLIAEVLAKLLREDAELSARFSDMAAPLLKNWNGLTVGSLRVTEALRRA